MAKVTWNVINHENGPCKVNFQVSSSIRLKSEAEARGYAKLVAERLRVALEGVEDQVVHQCLNGWGWMEYSEESV